MQPIVNNPVANLIAVACAVGAVWNLIVPVSDARSDLPQHQIQPPYPTTSCLTDSIDTLSQASLRFSLPAESVLVIGSMTPTTQQHRVTIVELHEDAAVVPPNSQVVHVNWSAIPEWSGTSPSFLPDTVVADDVVTDREMLESVAPLKRRFEVPYFCDGAVFNRYVEATMVLATAGLKVYVEVPAENSTAAAVRIASIVESGLRKFVEDEVGTITDVDGDGRLSIVLAPLTSGRRRECLNPIPVYGCVRATDFALTESDFGGDIIYIDPTIVDQDATPLLAHELAHAAIFSALQSESAPHRHHPMTVPCWLNEAMAHYVERRVRVDSGNLRDRLAQFCRQPHRYPVVIPDDRPCGDLRRGPARAAGCLFFESLMRQTGYSCVADLLKYDPLDWVDGGDRMETLLRYWALESTKDPTGLPVFELATEHSSTFDLSGTSFYRIAATPTARQLSVTASNGCRLQLTVVHIDD